MKKIKNIIFDFDGVLVKNMDILLEIHNKTLGPLTKKDFSDFFTGNSLVKGNQDYGLDKMNVFFEHWRDIFLELKLEEDAIDFLNYIVDDKNLFIVSSNMEDNINQSIKNSNLSESFFQEVLGKESGHCKTKKIIKLHDKLKLNIKDSILITDSLGDIKEGHAAGIKTVGVTWGIHEREILSEGKPFLIIDSWEELKIKF